MPIRAYKLQPLIEDSFWVNLLGKGYPAPSTKFRWCTDRLKIRNADRFILNQVAEYGEVITVLGVRKAESATRDQVINLYKIKDSILSRHSRFPGAFVYTPIVEFSVEDVWQYLLTTPSPWGNDNEELFQMYKDANAGECPLVVDGTTPSCGNSRFGCWVCTVVTKDRAIESLIDSGEEWLRPLLNFRNLLARTQRPENKKIFREPKRRHGGVDFKHGNTSEEISYGPYKMVFRRGFLRRILKIQENLRKEKPDMNITLIKPEELHEIRRIWQLEGRNSGDPIPRIYHEVTGRTLEWADEDIGSLKIEDEKLLKRICKTKDVPYELVYKMLEVERQVQGMNKRSSIFNRLDSILNEEWRPISEVREEQRKKLEQIALENNNDNY